jgi:hypothetical protein
VRGSVVRRGGLAEKSFVENEKDFLLDKSASIAGTGVLSELLTWHFLIKVQVVRIADFCRETAIAVFRQNSPRWLAEKRLPAGGLVETRPLRGAAGREWIRPPQTALPTTRSSNQSGAIATGGVQGSADSPTGRLG